MGQFRVRQVSLNATHVFFFFSKKQNSCQTCQLNSPEILFEKDELTLNKKLNTFFSKPFSSFKNSCMITYPKTLFPKNKNKIIQSKISQYINSNKIDASQSPLSRSQYHSLRMMKCIRRTLHKFTVFLPMVGISHQLIL